MPDRIAVSAFISEAWEDLSSPTTSNFLAAMNSCRNTVGSCEENLESDRTILHKLKKSIKAHHASGMTHMTNQLTLAENLEKLGSEALSREAETGIGTTFLKFSVMFKELCSLMKNLYTNYNNMVFFPLESLLRGDLKEVKGDLRRPFDKASKDYETKSSKIEKEKKKLAQEAGLIRTEVTGSEMVEETERERKVFQLQMCEYLLKVNEIKVKKGIELAQHLMEFYHAQVKYFQEGMQVLESIRGYVEESVQDLQQLRGTHEEEKKELLELKKQIKSYIQPEKESSPSGKGGYSLHGQQGDQALGTEKAGYLLKRSEGLRKVWQKRYCVIKNGQFSLAHSTTSSPSQTLTLLLCQVKEEEGKKRYFSLVSQNRTYLFQAEDEAEQEAWVSVVSNSRKEALEKAFGDNEQGTSDDSQSIVHNLKELRQSIVAQVQKLPGNDICCDCSAKDPTWLSTNLGVLTCIECSGIHRDMGTHISRVRSLTLDNLGTAELLLAKALGNGGFNEIMESNLGDFVKPTADSKMNERKEFIRAKYKEHKFAQKSGVTPEVLLQELHQSVKSRDILALLQGYAEGVDLTAPIPGLEKGSSALHVAIEQEDLKSLHIVDFLAQNAENLNVVDADGNTPVHLAAMMSKTECLKVLLRAGATDSLNLENKASKNPLSLATEAGDSETIELINAVDAGKLSRCDNVKIDWGMSEADGIYEDPLELLDKIDVNNEDEAMNELREKVRHNYSSNTWGSARSGQGVHAEVKSERILKRHKSEPRSNQTNPPTPPRHRRVLPTRPVSQMIIPPFRGGASPRTQGETTVSALVSGLNLFPKPETPVLGDRSVKVGGSPILRRKPPPPPSGNVEMVPVNVRQSVAVEPSGLGTTFGHSTSASPGSSNKASESRPDSPPPVPPVRCSSVSKTPGRHDGPLPPPPVPKPQHEVKVSTLPRSNPPIPPPPRRRGSDMKKPNVPPVPAHGHRRSKSEGKIIFGEDEVDMRRRLNTSVLHPGMVGTVKEVDNQSRRPTPPPRPLNLPTNPPSNEPLKTNLKKTVSKSATEGSPQSTGSIKDTPSISVSVPDRLDPSPATLPRRGLDLKGNEESTSKDQAKDGGKDAETPLKAPPEIYPRLYSSPNMSSHPRRVQALYDCEADNEDELTFREGEIILVTGDAEDDDWWMGEIEGRPDQKGVFPISFVHVLAD